MGASGMVRSMRSMRLLPVMCVTWATVLAFGCASDKRNGILPGFQGADVEGFEPSETGTPVEEDTSTELPTDEDVTSVDVQPGPADTFQPLDLGPDPLADSDGSDSAADGVDGVDGIEGTGLDTVSGDTDEPGDIGPADVDPVLDVEPADTAEPDTTEPDPTTYINEGFIGGLCTSNPDCPYTDGICLGAGLGYPDGECTQACDLYCPDEAGLVTTFCVDAGALPVPGPGGMCITRCAFGESPTGCRPGYACKLMERHGQPETKVMACVPDDGSASGLSECFDELVARGVDFEPAGQPGDHPEGHPEITCVIEEPVKIAPVLHGISFRYATIDTAPSKLFVSCPLALAIEEMAAELALDEVTDVIHIGTYNCRLIAGSTNLSQHGLANGIDIGGVGFGGGVVWTILDDWEDGIAAPLTAAGKFLKAMVQSLHDNYVFNIILTPEYNAAHDNHFHMDMTPGSHFLE